MKEILSEKTLRSAETVLHFLPDAKLLEFYSKSVLLEKDDDYRRGAKRHLTKVVGGRATNERIDRANSLGRNLIVAEIKRRGLSVPNGRKG